MGAAFLHPSVSQELLFAVQDNVRLHFYVTAQAPKPEADDTAANACASSACLRGQRTSLWAVRGALGGQHW